jgi:hypothetical protein
MPRIVVTKTSIWMQQVDYPTGIHTYSALHHLIHLMSLLLRQVMHAHVDVDEIEQEHVDENVA